MKSFSAVTLLVLPLGALGNFPPFFALKPPFFGGPLNLGERG